ncbi:MAG: DUF3108 domain-containing protein [Proteobacteria bacterium]|nr:DUF3108 domain-containing protein [Pseudomonadota bacterium]
MNSTADRSSLQGGIAYLSRALSGKDSMRVTPRHRLLPLFAGALLAGIAAGIAQAEPLRLRYDVTWGGLPAADIDVEIDESDGSYHLLFDLRTRGLPRLFSGLRARAEGVGRVADGRPQAGSRYDVTYGLRRKTKTTSIRYRDGGSGTLAEKGGLDTSSHLPLAERYRYGVVDPLAVMTILRELIRRGAFATSAVVTLPVYDGKRRFDVEANAPVVETIRWDRAVLRVLSVKLLLRPIAGFNGRDAEGEDDPDDAPRPARLLLTADEQLIPVRFETSIYYLATVVAVHDLPTLRPKAMTGPKPVSTSRHP